MLKELEKYLSMVKFSHTVFALPFALVGFFYGVRLLSGEFPFSSFIFVLICMISARNAAMGFNRYADRHIDALNNRTAVREIPAGVISPRRAAIFVVLNSVIFVIASYFINSLTFALSPVALVVVLGYSVTKRFTPLCHLVLGLALSIAPVGAYIAVTGSIDPFVIWIALLVMIWSGGFDILYALQDEQFDKDNGLFSIPALLGRKGALVVSALLHLCAIIIVGVIYCLYLHNIVFLIGGLLFSSILVYQHIIVTPKDISRVNMAFATLNGIGSVVFAAFTILSMFF